MPSGGRAEQREQREQKEETAWRGSVFAYRVSLSDILTAGRSSRLRRVLFFLQRERRVAEMDDTDGDMRVSVGRSATVTGWDR